MKTTFTFIVLLLVLLGCESENKSHESRAEIDSIVAKLNDSAMEKYTSYVVGRMDNIDSLEISLNELDKAIKIAPNVTELYTNKADVLLILERDKEAIRVLKKLISLKSAFAEGYSMIGFIHEKNGEKESAKEWFKKAMEAYDQRITEGTYVVNSKINKAFLLLFLENKISAVREFEKVESEHPDHEQVIYMKEHFENLNKSKFLESLTPQKAL